MAPTGNEVSLGSEGNALELECGDDFTAHKFIERIEFYAQRG